MHVCACVCVVAAGCAYLRSLARLSPAVIPISERLFLLDAGSKLQASKRIVFFKTQMFFLGKAPTFEKPPAHKPRRDSF